MYSKCYIISVFTRQFKIRNDSYIQIGYSAYKALTFGASTSTPNNGNFALEYCTGCTPTGLNIWKPWPTVGAANYLLFIRDNGNVGIGNNGDASATVKLSVAGLVKSNGVVLTSDARFKKEIKPINDQLSNNLLNIKTYQYKFIQNEKKSTNQNDSLYVNEDKTYELDYNFDDNLHFGMLAQDIEKVFPNLVTKDENGYLSLNYTEFIPLLIESLKEQNEKILKLEEEIILLKKKL
ncbi:MAG: tail fiber domain-containing protein [Flavobacteriia bacterium]